MIRTKAQVVLDEADYERAQQLVKTSATPVRELDQRKANLDIAHAQEMSAEAALRTAQLNLEWSEVRAPIAGRDLRSACRPRQPRHWRPERGDAADHDRQA